jgi:cyanate lyase
MTTFETSGHRTVAQLIQARQNELGITDQQIALALGYDHENVVAMIKKGAMRLPLNKVVELAGVLDVDATALLRLTLGENDTEMLQTIEKILGPMTKTSDEG